MITPPLINAVSMACDNSVRVDVAGRTDVRMAITAEKSSARFGLPITATIPCSVWSQPGWSHPIWHQGNGRVADDQQHRQQYRQRRTATAAAVRHPSAAWAPARLPRGSHGNRHQPVDEVGRTAVRPRLRATPRRSPRPPSLPNQLAGSPPSISGPGVGGTSVCVIAPPTPIAST